jgi:hypothetical protein
LETLAQRVRTTVELYLGGHGIGTVRILRQDFALEDAIGSHACSLEALPCV